MLAAYIDISGCHLLQCTYSKALWDLFQSWELKREDNGTSSSWLIRTQEASENHYPPFLVLILCTVVFRIGFFTLLLLLLPRPFLVLPCFLSFHHIIHNLFLLGRSKNYYNIIITILIYLIMQSRMDVWNNLLPFTSSSFPSYLIYKKKQEILYHRCSFHYCLSLISLLRQDGVRLHMK